MSAQRLTIVETDACFESVVGLIVSHITFGWGLAAYGGRDLSMMRSDAPCLYQGRLNASNIELEFRVKSLILNISSGKWPSQITFDVYPLGTRQVSMERPWKIEMGKDFGVWQGSSAFVVFYDSILDRIKAKYNDDPKTWPATLNFCRVCRNSFAHGNKIKIDNSNSPSVSWRGLSYSASNNGDPVLFKDLSFADLIVLMKEASDGIK